MLIQSIIKCVGEVTKNGIKGLTQEPVTYVNASAVAVSFTNTEIYLKIFLYSVSIIASILVSIKYAKEIRKMNIERQENIKADNKDHKDKCNLSED